MQKAASKQENQYLELLEFLQIHTFQEIPQLIPPEHNEEDQGLNEEEGQSN